MEDYKLTSEHFNTILHCLDKASRSADFMCDKNGYKEVIENNAHLVLKAIETGAEFVELSVKDLKSLEEIGAFGGME